MILYYLARDAAVNSIFAFAYSVRVCLPQIWPVYRERGIGVFGALFLIAKFIGHKQIAQLDFLITLRE